MSQDSKRFKSQPRWFWMFLTWAGMYILMHLGPLNYLVLIVMAGLVALALWSQSWRPIIIVMISPIVISFAVGVLSWFSKRPSFITYGLLARDFFNLSPDTRTYWGTMGCVMDGGEVLELGPRNLGLELMLTVFGNPPRTYDGPYPSKEDAEKWTSDSTVIQSKDFLSGVINLGQERVVIHASQAREMLRTLGLHDYLFDESEGGLLVRAHESSPECLLIRITCRREPGVWGSSDCIFLLDQKHMWPFAVYDLQPESYLHGAPYFARKGGLSELSTPKSDFSGPLY